MRRQGSAFIAVEGPHGVGKSTIAELLALRLAETAPVRLTAEPTDPPLGRLLRCEEWTLSGRSLALAVAGDRYAHIDDEIIPQLNAGRHVVTDGYVQSSLCSAVWTVWSWQRCGATTHSCCLPL